MVVGRFVAHKQYHSTVGKATPQQKPVFARAEKHFLPFCHFVSFSDKLCYCIEVLHICERSEHG